MSSRNYHASLLAVLSDPAIALVRFVELQFGTGTVYLHTDLGDITANDADSVLRTWTGVGALGSIGEIEQTDKLEHTADVALTLSGLESSIIDQVLNQNFVERLARIYVSARNVVTGALVVAPQLDISGRINSMDAMRDDGQLSVTVNVRSRFAELARAGLKYFTDAQLQADHPGDVFFEYLEQLQDVKVVWGDKHATLNYGKSSGGGAGSYSQTAIRSVLGGLF